MLHKLSLATAVNTPTLAKEAYMPPPGHAEALARDREKQKALMEARGAEAPKKTVKVQDPKTKKWVNRRVPDYDNVRMNPEALEEQAKRKAARSKKPVPKAPMQGHSALAEKEIQKAYGTVSNSTAKQFRHKYLGGAKRFWGGQNALKSKWGNRAALLGGLGTLGLGIKAYMDSNQQQPAPETPPIEADKPLTYTQYMQPDKIPNLNEVLQDLVPDYDEKLQELVPDYDEKLQDLLPKYKGVIQHLSPDREEEQPELPSNAELGDTKTSSSKYSPDAVTIPKPTPQPSIKALGPGIKSVTGPKSPKSPFSGGPSTGSSSASSTSSGTANKQAEDSGVLPLLGAAVGGVGGLALGQKYLTPTLKQQEKVLAAEIAKKQNQLNMLKTTTGKATLGTAAAGAILLAALTALYSKKKQEKKRVKRVEGPYDQTNAGFQRYHQIPYGNFYG